MQFYLGQILMFGFDWSQKGFALCQNQLLPIAQNQALFSILGTVYGGDGVRTFGLPDLRGRTFVSQGQGPGLNNYVLGELTGVENTRLLQANMAAHNHTFSVSNAAATVGVPGSGVVLSQGPVEGSATVPMYIAANPNGVMNANALAMAGASQPVQVLQPYLCVNFSIALQGIFPSRN